MAVLEKSGTAFLFLNKLYIMEIEIENYRGYEIRFNTEKETFVCDIDSEKSVKKSYSALKKFIDEFIKENAVFNSFYIIGNPFLNYSTDKRTLRVIGIRKDGRFIYEDEEKNKGQISDYSLESYILKEPCNDEYIKQLKDLEDEEQKLRELFRERRISIKSKLKVTTLKECKDRYLTK